MIITAAILFILMGLFHSYLGERFLLIPTFRKKGLPNLFGNQFFAKGTLRFCWHIMTVLCWMIAFLLIALHFEVSDFKNVFLLAVSVASFSCGLLSFICVRGRHLSWIALLAIAILTYLAA